MLSFVIFALVKTIAFLKHTKSIAAKYAAAGQRLGSVGRTRASN